MLSWRNRLACRLCNWILNHVATIEYRSGIDAVVRHGMRDLVLRADDVCSVRDLEIEAKQS